MPLPALIIEAVMPDGHVPYSSFRGQDVGVGGKYSFGPFAGGPVRRATLSELRHLDRCTVLKIKQLHPDATIRFRRVK